MPDEKTICLSAPKLRAKASMPMPPIVAAIVAVYMLAALTAITYVLLKIWPQDASRPVNALLLGFPFTLAPDKTLLVLTALAGALGAFVHLLTSFADYAGNDGLTTSWAWWYILRPFVGVALAEIVYLTVRGGLLAGTGDAAAVNPYGVAAIAALTGMFSRQATDKLREVFETVFRTQQKVDRKDPLPVRSESDAAD